MKTRVFLGMGLLLSAIGFGQTTTLLPATTAGTANNTVVGTSATPASTGINNVFLGWNAGITNNNGTNNVFVGKEAGQGNEDGSYNICIGLMAGRDSEDAQYNISIGREAGLINNEGHNIFIGYTAGRDNDGESNVFVGESAGRGNEGNHNSYYGFSAGSNPTTATIINNCFFGANSGKYASGNNNTCFGMTAGLYATGNNVYVGHSAGRNTTGNDNVFMGFFAGNSLTAGDGNVFIGNLAGSAETTANELLFIDNSATPDPLIHGDFLNNELKFNANKVGIGPTFGDLHGLNMTGENAVIYRLFVKGGILAEEIRVRLEPTWPDYVFAKDYKLLSLKETEKYIIHNGHLPNMPSAQQVKEEGLEFGNIATLQQEKIEELTLHLIEQDKQIEELKAQVQLLLNK